LITVGSLVLVLGLFLALRKQEAVVTYCEAVHAGEKKPDEHVDVPQTDSSAVEEHTSAEASDQDDTVSEPASDDEV
jgi:hypothetical protein